MQNKSVQIPYELFFQLLQYFLMDNYDGEEIIRLGLEKKLQQIQNSTNGRRKRKVPEGISGQTGNTGELSMVKVLSEHFITGACHAPVRSKQGESW